MRNVCDVRFVHFFCVVFSSGLWYWDFLRLSDLLSDSGVVRSLAINQNGNEEKEKQMKNVNALIVGCVIAALAVGCSLGQGANTQVKTDAAPSISESGSSAESAAGSNSLLPDGQTCNEENACLAQVAWGWACCDGGGNVRCGLNNGPFPVGSVCVCFGQGHGWVC